ncbi:MAG: hypothetical protein ACE147_21390 [Candidatus Methylomirabilales bacterium]
MSRATQLLLEVDDAPGALARLAALLADAGVEVAGVWAIPHAQHGAFVEPTDNRARALTEAASRLADAGINTICAYAPVDGTRPVAVILNAADAAKAAGVLRRIEEARMHETDPADSPPEMAVRRAWAWAGRRCECRRGEHGHGEPCGRALEWERRGQGGPGGWEARSRPHSAREGAPEILCWECSSRAPVTRGHNRREEEEGGR